LINSTGIKLEKPAEQGFEASLPGYGATRATRAEKNSPEREKLFVDLI
jgi:hypothetical protein